MEDFTGLVLCNRRGNDIEVHVRVDFVDGALRRTCHDLGPFVKMFSGRSDYEYWYSLDQANTAKLFSVIRGEQDPKAALIREFSGEGGCRRLREICEDNDIQYRFYSHP